MRKHIQLLAMITMLTMAMLTIGCLFQASAASLSIGVAKSSGDFLVDGSRIRGNGTLFEGTVVETSRESSEIELLDGERLTLAPGSRATIYHDRTTLEAGVGTARNTQRHAVDVGNFRVSSPAPEGILQVTMTSPGHIVVSARVGAADVRTPTGMLVARVLAGTALGFNPQAGATTTSMTLNGCLVGQGDAFLLTDSTSNVTFEIQGLNLSKFAGSHVEITGSIRSGVAPVLGADQLVRAAKVSALGPCRSKSAAAPSANGGSGNAGSSKHGIASMGTVAVVGGVVVAATVGGLASAGTFSSATPASPK